MSMRMVADVETLEVSGQKDHNEFVTTCDVECECVSMVLQGVLLELLLSMNLNSGQSCEHKLFKIASF